MTPVNTLYVKVVVQVKQGKTVLKLRIHSFSLFISTTRDESDEDNCKMLVQKENYNKKVSPFQYDYLNDIVIPVDVKISVAIMDILSIQEIDQNYVAKFRLLMEWYDYR